MKNLVFCVLLCFLQVFCSSHQNVDGNGGYIPFGKVRAFLLHRSQNASRQYLPAAQQLNCLGGCKNSPSAVECTIARLPMNSTHDLDLKCEAKFTTFTSIKVENITCEYNRTHILPKSCSVDFKVDTMLRYTHLLVFSAFCAAIILLVLFVMCYKMLCFYCKNINKVKFRNNFKRIRKHPKDVDLALLDGVKA